MTEVVRSAPDSWYGEDELYEEVCRRILRPLTRHEFRQVYGTLVDRFVILSQRLEPRKARRCRWIPEERRAWCSRVVGGAWRSVQSRVFADDFKTHGETLRRRVEALAVSVGLVAVFDVVRDGPTWTILEGGEPVAASHLRSYADAIGFLAGFSRGRHGQPLNGVEAEAHGPLSAMTRTAAPWCDDRTPKMLEVAARARIIDASHDWRRARQGQPEEAAGEAADGTCGECGRPGAAEGV